MQATESCEMRWFVPYDREDMGLLRDLFQGVLPEEWRVDVYVVDPRRLDINLKERDAQNATKLEVKYRTGTLGSVRLTQDLVGCLEAWEKLSFPRGKAVLEEHSQAVAVRKSRQLRKFGWSEGRWREVPGTDRPGSGCAVELTEVEGRQGDFRRRAWTFAFEAFGQHPGRLHALLGSLPALTENVRLPTLSTAESFGYPEWLARSFPALG